MKSRKLFIIVLLLGFVASNFFACKAQPSYEFLPFEDEVHHETKRKTTAFHQTTGLAIPEQPDSEVKWTSSREAPRGEMTPELNKFIRENIFWAGKSSVLLINHQKNMLRYIWIDPLDITPELRYGADIICVSNLHSRHFSPKDIQTVDDGYSTMISPELVDYNYSLCDHEIFVKPYASLNIKGTKISTTPASVKGVTGQETWNNNVGFIFWLQGYSIWYTGALSREILAQRQKSQGKKADLSEDEIHRLIPGTPRNDLSLINNIDIMIIPIATPARISADFVIELAEHINAKAIYIVGHDLVRSEALEDFRKKIFRNSPVPFWYPEKFKTNKNTSE